MLYLGKGKIIEATKFHNLVVIVGVRTLKKALEDSGSEMVQVHRHPEMTPDKASALIANALSKFGCAYDDGALLSPHPALSHMKGLSNNTFCSEFIVMLFKEIGVDLTGKATGRSTPDDIADFVPYAGHLKTGKGDHMIIEFSFITKAESAN
jgi:hypothetical protein